MRPKPTGPGSDRSGRTAVPRRQGVARQRGSPCAKKRRHISCRLVPRGTFATSRHTKNAPPPQPVDSMRTIRSIGLLAVLSIAAATSGEAQVDARYAKTELRVPMRDGTQLFTVVYAPRDTSRRYPIMLRRQRRRVPSLPQYMRASSRLQSRSVWHSSSGVWQRNSTESAALGLPVHG